MGLSYGRSIVFPDIWEPDLEENNDRCVGGFFKA
jgi:hypothetical protein